MWVDEMALEVVRIQMIIKVIRKEAGVENEKAQERLWEDNKISRLQPPLENGSKLNCDLQ